jgi:hypothetical protein
VSLCGLGVVLDGRKAVRFRNVIGGLERDRDHGERKAGARVQAITLARTAQPAGCVGCCAPARWFRGVLYEYEVLHPMGVLVVTQVSIRQTGCSLCGASCIVNGHQDLAHLGYCWHMHTLISPCSLAVCSFLYRFSA